MEKLDKSSYISFPSPARHLLGSTCSEQRLVSQSPPKSVPSSFESPAAAQPPFARDRSFSQNHAKLT